MSISIERMLDMFYQTVKFARRLIKTVEVECEDTPCVAIVRHFLVNLLFTY